MAKSKKPEALLATRVANHLKTEYPMTVFRFDLAADLKMTIGQASRNKALHGKFNSGFPDLCVYGSKGAFFLELKAGKVPNTAHTRNQRAFHEVLRHNGYVVEFICSYDEAKQFIKDNIWLKEKIESEDQE